ncbi:MAG: DEAD/DEAH box helicase [Planctomycetes bacterium]|nr:DEAD/DEAH box helicase [Planctomycetota bacterium]
MKFSELGLPPTILKVLYSMGYDEMTPIQEATYHVISAGHDICALAETGTGKTAACAIPLIQMVDTKLNAIQGLIVVPTRELCLQYVSEIQKIAVKTGVVPFAVYGGFSKQIQAAKIRHEVHILVATPGRLIDLIYDGIVTLGEVKCVILDEADELLNVGFLSDIEFIMSCLVHEHQTMLFSATMADDIKKLTETYLRDPQHISLITKQASPKSIEHYFKYIHPNAKQADLVDYFQTEKIRQAIIFCNARHQVDRLFGSLKKQVKDLEFIHGGLAQEKRTSIIRRFRQQKIHALIATDVAGRGLDFTHVSHIINWDFPRELLQYTHRTGRTGRMGRRGLALTYIAKHDLSNLRKLLQTRKLTAHWLGKDGLNPEKGGESGKAQARAKTGKKRLSRRRRPRRRQSASKAPASGA